jgi:hypothetical protein
MEDSMRDGIPKTIPVPRKWQKYVEVCDRAADRGTQRVIDRLIDAVRHTFAKYFTREDRQLLQNIADESQGTLPGICPVIPVTLRPSLLAELLTTTQRVADGGKHLRAALVEGLAAIMESDIAAHNRQISEDLAGKCRPHELTRVQKEMQRATMLFDSKAEAERMLDSVRQQRSDKVSPDEDIRQ